ncbi:Tigger transposable element-derived protein 6-like [Oopsacas minuta]|uniref:Tigger transposable element-derived protein 6-like n=1 Tax=Oopsacas minuta TaxID=111878 RepID=A0AAV7K1G1_9METZ|nr:Tigger transposable element-derived protein 6-like [Oopsacas minuta]
MVTYHESSPKQLTNVKRERKGKDPEVDERLNQWFELVTSKISRWKVRHQGKAKKVHGEKASADRVTAKHWLETVLPKLMKDYESQDVFNADETALFYRETPDGSLGYAYKNLCSSKKAMERLTVLCCANMTGSDKCMQLTAIDVSSKISIFDAVGFISESWRAVKSTTMANCIHKAGFSNNTLLSNETPVTNECISLGIEEVVNGEEYDEIDHDDTTCFEPEKL